MRLYTALKNRLMRKSKYSAEPLCPLPQRINIENFGKVQIFVPHPDDESIGCGGLLALLAQQGCDIQAVLVTDGSGAGELPDTAKSERHAEFIAALHTLGINNYRFLDFPDGEVQHSEELRAALSGSIKEFKPDSLLMPSVLDLHRDHRVIAHELLNESKKISCIRQVVQYEIWCPLPITHIIDITGVANIKWQAINQHKTALKYGEYLTASEGLARYRALLLGPFGNPQFAEGYVIEKISSIKNQRAHWLNRTSIELIKKLSKQY